MTGRIHLVGGGRDEDLVAPLVAAFVSDARTSPAHGFRPPIALLVVREDGDEETEARFARILNRAGADVQPHIIVEGDEFAPDAVLSAAGIFVAGGLTPEYSSAVDPIADAVRERVRGGIPYMGFSAGAAIAADRALIGGYRIDGVEVCDIDAGEETDEVTVVEGLGLVPFTVEVHAAQWGTVARAIAAIDADRITTSLAIDEHTAYVHHAGADFSGAAVSGAGAVWQVAGTRDGARVRRHLARARTSHPR